MRFHLPGFAARAQRRHDDDRAGQARECPLAIASGGVLAATAFAQHWALQLPAVVAMAAAFWLLRTVPARRAYSVGVLFTLAWLVPTTYWYYNFMSLGAALGASIGWALLMANLFHLAALREKLGTRLVWPLFAILWLALTWLRLRMPVTEDWWLPHLGYSVWRNSGLVWLGGFGGETALEAVVLAGGMAVAAAFVRRGPWAALAAGATAIASVIGLNAISQSLPAKPIPPVIAVQAMTAGGVDAPATEQDVSDLIDMTREALGGDYARSTTVVWPENSIPESAQRRVADVAAELRVNIAYHTTEHDGEGVYKKTVVVDGSTGQAVLANYKQHLAPDEKLGVSRASRSIVELGDRRVTAYICYDMHYPDVVGRLSGSDVAYVPLNDAAYGYLQKQFHAADIALHAAQADTAVVVASTNGPTMIVNSNGVVTQFLNTSDAGHLRN